MLKTVCHILVIIKNVDILFKVQNIRNINSKVLKTKNGAIMFLAKCAICGSRKSRFQEAKGFLSNIGLKTPLSKTPILGDVLY